MWLNILINFLSHAHLWLFLWVVWWWGRGERVVPLCCVGLFRLRKWPAAKPWMTCLVPVEWRSCRKLPWNVASWSSLSLGPSISQGFDWPCFTELSLLFRTLITSSGKIEKESWVLRTCPILCCLCPASKLLGKVFLYTVKYDFKCVLIFFYWRKVIYI